MTEPFVTAPSQGVPLAPVQVAVHVSADAPAGSPSSSTAGASRHASPRNPFFIARSFPSAPVRPLPRTTKGRAPPFPKRRASHGCSFPGLTSKRAALSLACLLACCKSLASAVIPVRPPVSIYLIILAGGQRASGRGAKKAWQKNIRLWKKTIDKGAGLCYDYKRRLSGKRRGVEQFGSSSGS